jgi:ComF family protein
LRHAIHQLKYYGDLALGEALARPMIDLYSELHWQVDLVVPVPLGIARRAERGYNQASLLAWPIALSCDLSYRPKALRRWRETPSQVGLNMLERRLNLLDAFQARPDLVDGKAVLLVDDVTTTGATMQACALALRKAGVDRIYGLTLARTAFQPYQV